MIKSILIAAIITFSAAGCGALSTATADIITGAERTGYYLPLLDGSRVGVVANQTSMVGSSHLIDTLLALGADLRIIFAPEHGFRDMADAGQRIAGGIDEATGVPVVSLYGASFRPQPSDMGQIDIVIFDIQDVGARFYTYISTMHYVMEAAAENGVKVIILDRPNPHAHYIDGPLLEPAHRSFVGMHPVPVVHGMTVGEYALMVNGEGWLAGGARCDLTVVSCLNYTRSTRYTIPIRPSPNLPNQLSIDLYPSLCFFEGTNVSVGRGTPFPFQVYGSPDLPPGDFSFTPASVAGATSPPFLGIVCHGTDLRDAGERGLVPPEKLMIEFIIDAWNVHPDKNRFFTGYFEKLAGTSRLREQIEAGMNAGEIRESWRDDLAVFAEVRARYLLYE